MICKKVSENEKERKNMKFNSKDHENSYNQQLERCNISKDAERQALIYLLTLTNDLRNHFEDCYDKTNSSINSDVINSAWVTSTDAKIIRLAFNLFNWSAPTVESGDDINNYLPINIFDTDLRDFLFEAVKIRFE